MISFYWFENDMEWQVIIYNLSWAEVMAGDEAKEGGCWSLGSGEFFIRYNKLLLKVFSDDG